MCECIHVGPKSSCDRAVYVLFAGCKTAAIGSHRYEYIYHELYNRFSIEQKKGLPGNRGPRKCYNNKMNQLRKRAFIAACMVLAFSFIGACAGRHPLRTAPVAETDRIRGMFRVILYGTASYDWLESVALLDREGDGYLLEPYAPDFNYRVLQNVDDENAIDEAIHFISAHQDYYAFATKKILAEDGKTIGYEIKPTYYPFVYGFREVLDVDYFLLENGTVKVTIEVIPPVRELFLGGDDPGISFQ